MQRRDQVAVLQGSADSRDNRLLACARIHATKDFVLPMKPRDAILETANQLHPVVELELEFDASRAVGRVSARALDLSHHAPRRSASNHRIIARLHLQ